MAQQQQEPVTRAFLGEVGVGKTFWFNALTESKAISRVSAVSVTHPDAPNQKIHRNQHFIDLGGLDFDAKSDGAKYLKNLNGKLGCFFLMCSSAGGRINQPMRSLLRSAREYLRGPLVVLINNLRFNTRADMDQYVADLATFPELQGLGVHLIPCLEGFSEDEKIAEVERVRGIVENVPCTLLQVGDWQYEDDKIRAERDRAVASAEEAAARLRALQDEAKRDSFIKKVLRVVRGFFGF